MPPGVVRSVFRPALGDVVSVRIGVPFVVIASSDGSLPSLMRKKRCPRVRKRWKDRGKCGECRRNTRKQRPCLCAHAFLPPPYYPPTQWLPGSRWKGISEADRRPVTDPTVAG